MMRYLSLFSGIEGAHLGWRGLGWQCVAVAEIDRNACAVLRERLPDIPNLGSVTDITPELLAPLGPIDVVIGGSPCQDLSIAGKRAGLSGERSGLFHEQLRIFHAARKHCGARWLVWENVPGAFSSHDGRDFAVVVGQMAGCQVAVPADGWGSEGMALGENGLVEWCVLDAQWFGVAQRRRRVFAVLDTGNWSDRQPVLLESDSLRGDFAPSREAWEGVTGTLSARPTGGGGLGTDFECQGGLVSQWPAEVASTLNASFGSKLGLEDQHALGGGHCSSLPQVSACLTTGTGRRFDPDKETLIPTIGGGFDVAHSLRADGFDASEDGTGRGTPLVPVAFDCKASGRNGFGVCEVSPTLRAMAATNGHNNAGGQGAVAVALRGRDGGATAELGDECGNALRASRGGGDKPHVLHEMAVRRLTPRECERLQGVPDDWTLVTNDHGRPMADGPRYKMIGNGFAVPCITWIGTQIELAEAA